MQDTYNRRSFLGMDSQVRAAQQAGKALRVGFVGVGARGSYHLNLLLQMGMEVPALCDVDDGFLYRAKKWVTDAGRPAPALYSRGKTDYLRLCDRDDLDLVMTATPWQFHAPVCLAAMKAGKHAATEVPAALTMDQCWELVETSHSSGKHCIMVEQDGYNAPTLALLNMVQKGVFGKILHGSAGYVHDLRLVKFDPEHEPWRLQFSVDRNANQYPTHPMIPLAWWLDINRGDRIEYLVSMSTKAVTLNQYTAHFFGDRHPYAYIKMAQGDVNTSLLYTAQGKTIALHLDTNTPHPHTTEMRLQGSKGLYVGNSNQIYLEGRSPKQDEWEPAAKYLAEYEHPLVRAFSQKKLGPARGHGGGDATPLMWHRLLAALRTGKAPDQNVYDAVTVSAIIPLTEQSIRTGKPVDFPDFTRGAWKTTPSLDLS